MTTRPLVQNLWMVDAEKKLIMGFIYSAMDGAKELIASNVGVRRSGKLSMRRGSFNFKDICMPLDIIRIPSFSILRISPQTLRSN